MYQIEMNRKWYHEFDVRIPELFWPEKIRFDPNIIMFLHSFLLLGNSDIANNNYNNHESYNSEISIPLSLREKQVLNLLVSGYSNDMISEELCISFHTVKTHIYKIYKKISVCNRVQAVRWANNNLSISG